MKRIVDQMSVFLSGAVFLLISESPIRLISTKATAPVAVSIIKVSLSQASPKVPNMLLSSDSIEPMALTNDISLWISRKASFLFRALTTLMIARLMDTKKRHQKIKSFVVPLAVK